MAEVILVDAGPLVALLDQREQHHLWAVEQTRQLRLPLFTCEAVLSETCFLLADHSAGLRQIEAYAEDGALKLRSLGAEAFVRVLMLMRRYANVPMSFADACLVALAESQPGARIFTLDRDFFIYRRDGNQPLTLLAPFAE